MDNNTLVQIKTIKLKTEIYKRFSLELLHTICEYYLDKEALNNDNDIQNHFNWCYTKVCDKFLKEGYNFYYNDTLKDYFYIYYYENIYLSTKFDTKEKISKNIFEEFWKKIFDISTTKDKNILAIFGEIYKIFDKSSSISNSIILEEDDSIILEKNKIMSKNIDINKFNKIYNYCYANNTIALAELKSGKLIFIDIEGNELVEGITENEINSMDIYIRGVYYNQVIGNQYFYTVSSFIYLNNTLAKAETIKGKNVFIKKNGEISKYNEKF